MPTADFIAITEDLRALGGRRVWSLMISLFGDLAQKDGQAIEGPVLSAFMDQLQVKPEAVRVALHRLRNDGWIVSEKSGRISRHSLTAKGRNESAAASPRIYADPAAPAQDWCCVLLSDTSASSTEHMTRLGFSQLIPRVYFGAADTKLPSDAMRLEGSDLPDWLKEQLQPEEVIQGYKALLTTLETLKTTCPDPNSLSAIETAVLRCLIVHNWRRLVLKHPALPAALLPADWVGHRCHVMVHDLLQAFARPALSAIDLQQAAA